MANDTLFLKKGDEKVVCLSLSFCIFHLNSLSLFIFLTILVTVAKLAELGPQFLIAQAWESHQDATLMLAAVLPIKTKPKTLVFS